MAILHMGRRTATYELATLYALIHYCEENAPLDDACAAVDVPIDDLADRVIEMYGPGRLLSGSESVSSSGLGRG
jgi:hypothetical protein